MINHIIYIIFIILITIIIIDISIIITIIIIIIICSDCIEMPLGIGFFSLDQRKKGAMNGSSPLEMELDMEGHVEDPYEVDHHGD